MVADVNQTRSCTTWNGSSEGFQEEFPKVKLIGWDASLQDSQEWKNLAFNWRNLFKWPWSVSGKGFHIPSIWAKTSAKFCSSSLFHVFHPQCVFLLFFSSLLPHKFPTGVLFSSIPGRVAKREAELRPLVIEQHYACGGWLLNGPSHLLRGEMVHEHGLDSKQREDLVETPWEVCKLLEFSWSMVFWVMQNDFGYTKSWGNQHQITTGWWFQTSFVFIPISGKRSNLTCA